MTRKSKLFSRVLAGAALVAALTGADSCDSKTVEITLLHTNDIHSHLRAEKTPSERNPYGLGGLARLKTLVERIRGEKPGALLFDAGDWSEGTAYFHADAGSNMLKLFNSIGYNAVVVGNHDFFNGPVELANTVERAGAALPVLGANKDLSSPKLAKDRERIQRAIPDYSVITAGNGIRVAAIGVLCVIPAFYSYFEPGRITDPIARTAEIAKKIRTENLADVIVVISHNDMKVNQLIAKSVPFVNVVVSGHGHRKTPQPIVVTNAGNPVYVVEARHWGQFLGELNLTVDKKNKQVTLKSYTLHPVRADIPENAEIARMIAEQDLALSARYGKDVVHDHVADAEGEYVQMDGRETVLATMAAEAYRVAAAADIGIESSNLIGVGVSEGPLSSLDILNLSPHIFHPRSDGSAFPDRGGTWTVHRLKIRGAELRLAFNVAMRAGDLLSGSWTSVSGARVTYSPAITAKDLLPIRHIEVYDPVMGQYQGLEDEAYYTVALNDGSLLALRELKKLGHLPIDISQVEDLGLETWQAVLDLIRARGSVIRGSDFPEAGHYLTIEPDLSVYEHGVGLKSEGGGYKVSVTLQNEGLAPSPAGAVRLRVLRGEPNDPVNDKVPGIEETLISGEISLPEMAPGAKTTIDVPWTNLPKAGIYGLRVVLAGDRGNPRNDVVHRHFHVSPTRR